MFQDNTINKQIEEWRDIPGYEGFYEISNHGRVRRIYRRLMAKRETRDGYIRLNLSKDGKTSQVFVHQTVLKTFGPSQKMGQQTNHKNGHKKDNRIENLEWVTVAENIRHRDKVLGNGPVGSRNGSAILTKDDVKEIRLLRAKGWTCRRIALRYPVGRAAISHIVTGRSWKHID